MSRRRIASGFNATSSFSLRNCVTEDNKSFETVSATHNNNTTKPMETPPSFTLPQATSVSLDKNCSTQVPNLSGISFKFNANMLSSNALATEHANEHGHAALEINSLVPKKATRHTFGIPSLQNKNNSNIAINPEIMRLTAQTDDLRTRLKSATDRSMFLETQLSRIQKVAMKDRKEFSQQMAIARSELNVMKEAEEKLKSQIAKNVVSVERKNAFETAVKTAMKSHDIVEEQTKFDELVKKQTNLHEELDRLQSRRDKLIAETDAFQKQRESDQLESDEQVNAMRTEIEKAEKKLMALNEENEAYQAAFEEHSSASNQAEETLSKKRYQLECAEQKMSNLESSLETLTRDIESRNQNVFNLESKIRALVVKETETAARIDDRKNCLQRTNGIVVLGDACPSPGIGFQIGFPYDTGYKRVDDMSSYCNGIPTHFNLDAPISLTGNLTQISDSPGDENDSNTEAMLSAIVGDLKTYLAQASVENDKRGLARRAVSVGATDV